MLGQSLVLKILDLSDEVSVQALASSPLEHPDESSLRGILEDIKGLHVVDPDGASHLVRRKMKKIWSSLSVTIICAFPSLSVATNLLYYSVKS